MQFATRVDGEYRIYAGSLEQRAGVGFMAAVVVNRTRAGRAAEQEVHRDVALSGGHLWATSHEALTSALTHGHQVVQHERSRS